jgi:hypothetical protein
LHAAGGKLLFLMVENMTQLLCSLGTLAVVVLGIAVLLGILSPAKAFHWILRVGGALVLTIFARNIVGRLLTPAFLAQVWAALTWIALVAIISGAVYLVLLLVLHLLSRSEDE